MKKRWIILLIVVAIIIALIVTVKLLPFAYTITAVVAFLCGVRMSYLIKPKVDVYKNS